ncbi:MAG TPA: phosphoribosylformylglycinamidine synthase subunit PurL [Candidatus Dormibacteraeota bacterium]
MITRPVEVPEPRVLAEVALTETEYRRAVDLLGRAPNGVELGIIGALWSEHCGYKTSKPLLRRLPTRGARVLQGPGENAGAVDIGAGLAAVFKIESHNHPSAIEPYQGAATGVGGILRDVFTMGARPVALLDSLRFGPLEEPEQRRLFDGVVAGIGGYGNCIGVPTVGGEVYFDESYRHNCLVNAMCVGVLRHEDLTRARASGPGNPVLLVGADTGRDGIHGATFASVELDAQSEARRPAVQVGNPFLEKCLMEACLELAGDPRVVAMQDLGAAGLTSSATELAHRGGCGIELDVERVSRRERGMTPYEVMLSESQERMLLVVRAGEEGAVMQAFDRWDLHSDVIGRITDDGRLRVHAGDGVVCDLPLAMLIDDVPLRHPPLAPRPRPWGAAADLLAAPPPWPLAEALLRLLGSPNIGSRRPVFRRYDHQVGDDTVVLPGGDAAVLRIKGTALGVAVTTDGNARYGALDPRRGAEIAVVEAARNCVAVGAEPLAVTNCLNFGNPEKPEVFWQLSEAVDGLAAACAALDTPVVSGNVSLYNDTSGVSIDPTTVVGMVGRLGDVGRRLTPAFGAAGDRVFLVGPVSAELGGSEYQRLAHEVNCGPPPALDLGLERRVQDAVRAAAEAGLLRSAHDCSEGGLAVALAECAIAGAIGVRALLPELAQPTGLASEAAGILFGESQSRFVVSCPAEDVSVLREHLEGAAVPFLELGPVGGDEITVGTALDVSVRDARAAYDAALETG